MFAESLPEAVKVIDLFINKTEKTFYWVLFIQSLILKRIHISSTYDMGMDCIRLQQLTQIILTLSDMALAGCAPAWRGLH